MACKFKTAKILKRLPVKLKKNASQNAVVKVPGIVHLLIIKRTKIMPEQVDFVCAKCTFNRTH
jgi:hypothetical protein